MDLKDVKKRIRIVSSDEKLNAGVLDMIKQEHDCFGVDYGPDQEECKKCTIFAELDDRRATLWEFCKELTPAAVQRREEEKEEKEPLREEKKEETKKEKEETKKEKANINEYGHRLDAQSGVIDSLLKEGIGLEDAEKELSKIFSNYKQGRFKGYLRHLIKEHGVEIEEKDGFYKIKR